MSKPYRRTALISASLLAAGAVVATVVGLASARNGHSLAAVAASATARFHDLDAARAAGWNTVVADLQGITCIDNQPIGGMGVHYANGPLLGDALADPRRPEALVYAPNSDGRLKLAALEYIIFQQAWKDAGHDDAHPPELFGQTFSLTPAGNRFGLDPFYSLHVWLWRPNSAGEFQPWNPAVHC